MSNAFIYFHHTPSGVVARPSRVLAQKVRRAGSSKSSVTVKTMLASDPLAAPLMRLIRTIYNLAGNAGIGGRGGSVPTASNLAPFVEKAAAACGLKAQFLPTTAVQPARILVQDV